MRFAISRLCIVVVVTLGSLVSQVAIDAAPSLAQSEGEAQLLALHRSERRAHFAHDTQWFLDHMKSQILDVRDGRINELSREEVKRRFTDYFRAAKFSKWDDVSPPVVRISPDGQMGWMIVRVRIAYSGTDASGKPVKEDSVLAWMSTYEKMTGKWLMTAVTTTAGPSQ